MRDALSRWLVLHADQAHQTSLVWLTSGPDTGSLVDWPGPRLQHQVADHGTQLHGAFLSAEGAVLELSRQLVPHDAILIVASGRTRYLGLLTAAVHSARTRGLLLLQGEDRHRKTARVAPPWGCGDGLNEAAFPAAWTSQLWQALDLAHVPVWRGADHAPSFAQRAISLEPQARGPAGIL